MMRRVFSCSFAMCALAAYPTWSWAVPAAIPYTGLLTHDTGSPVSATIDVQVHLFAVEQGGAPIWGYDFGTVDVEQGLLSLVLGGSGQPAVDAVLINAANASVWVEIEIDGTTLTPRQRIYSVPYALISGDSERLGGQLPAVYATQSDLAAKPAIASRTALPPSDPSDGQLWFDTGAAALKLWDAGAQEWLPVGGIQSGSVQVYASCKAVAAAGLPPGFYTVQPQPGATVLAYCDTIHHWEIRTVPLNQNLQGNRDYCTTRGMFLAVPDSTELASLTAALNAAFNDGTVHLRVDLAIQLSTSCSGPLYAQNNAGASEAVSSYQLPGITQCSATSGATYVQGAQLRHASSGQFYSAVGSGNHGGSDQTGWTRVCLQANTTDCTNFAAESAGPFTVCEWN